jgi:GNAT superfamily N-acetyltransferase
LKPFYKEDARQRLSDAQKSNFTYHSNIYLHSQVFGLRLLYFIDTCRLELGLISAYSIVKVFYWYKGAAMPHILSDFSTPALVLAVKQNLYELFDFLRQWDKTDFFDNQKLKRWWTPIPYPWYNGVLSLTPPEGETTQTIRQTIDYFRARERSPFTWWLAPELEASGWAEQLLLNGLQPDNNTPGMALELARLNTEITLLTGLRITRVENEPDMRTFARIFVDGYGLPDDWQAPVLDMLQKIGINFPWHSYLAQVNGEPVATAAVFYGAGVAGIQMVATLPQWRGKGLGAAVTLASLVEARKIGYRVGILQSSEMGFKVYQRLGFKEVRRMLHYAWPGE